jgi:hypothetical protein
VTGNSVKARRRAQRGTRPGPVRTLPPTVTVRPGTPASPTGDGHTSSPCGPSATGGEQTRPPTRRARPRCSRTSRRGRPDPPATRAVRTRPDPPRRVGKNRSDAAPGVLIHDRVDHPGLRPHSAGITTRRSSNRFWPRTPRLAMILSTTGAPAGWPKHVVSSGSNA